MGILKIPKATTAQRTSITPAVAELIFDTDEVALYKGDGVTVGGVLTDYPGADATKVSYLTVTQAVDLDTMESDIATNNAKVTNATHTGEVTGSGALTVDKTAITNKTTVTAVSGDFMLISDTSDGGNLKKVDVADVLGGGGGLETKSGHEITASFAGDPKTVSVTFTTAFADANYSVNTTAVVNVANKSYVTQVLNKTASGFDITLGTGSTDELVGVDWTATKHGES